MKTYIVLINVDEERDARSNCELIENTVFPDANNAMEVRNRVVKLIDCDAKNVEVEPITDFMDRVNDELFNPDNYFMSYVYSK